MFERAAVFSGLLILGATVAFSHFYFDYVSQIDPTGINPEVTSATVEANN